MDNKLPKSAEVVIIGGGIAGCSVAYHLTKLGVRDIVLVERKTLTGGTTWHAAGLVTQLRNSRTLIELAKYGVDLYSNLEHETGLPIRFNQTGSISVAHTKGRMDELKKITSLGRAHEIEIQQLTPHEAAEMWPLMNAKDLVGAIHIPKDGQIIPSSAALAMASGARDRGAIIIENTKVRAVNTNAGTVNSVSTTLGDIDCRTVVCCAGMWSREIGSMCGVSVPLHAAEHMYLVTNPMGIPENLPSLRDPDKQIYFRHDTEETGSLLMGGFETTAKPWGANGIPDDYHFGLIDPDWEHFKVFWENAISRVPSMSEAGINRFYVSAESFTPDNKYLMGETPEVRNFFVATGLNSTGIAAGPGVGKAIAEWIVSGHPTMDLTEVDIKRFHRFQNNPKYLYDRTKESVGTLYGMHWPHVQMETARGARRSPIHNHLSIKGACYGSVAGWERPNWFAPEGVKPEYKYSYHRQNWFTYSAKEHHAVRENVGFFDQTSFAKFLLQGRDSESVLQSICANDIAVPIGRIVYTSMLNELGGIEADVTVTRLEQNSYLIITGSASSTKDLCWIQDHIPLSSHTFLTDVSSMYAVFGVMGPNSRNLLQKLSPDDLSNKSFPYLRSREITIGYAPVRASRVTYVGELGWELYVPMEFATHVYELLAEEGEAIGMKHAGFHALESLRIEKAYREWGTDITDQNSPLEAGLQFAVSFSKNIDFIGKKALLKQLETGIKKRLMVFTLDSPKPLLQGDEPIYRNGILSGHTTSGNFGHTIGKSIALGYLEKHSGIEKQFLQSGTYEIEILDSKYLATSSLYPAYDRHGTRVRH